MPNEMLFGEASSYENFRVMGCLCCVAKDLIPRDKFESEELNVFSLGMPLQGKGI